MPIAHLLNLSVEIQRRTRTSDGAGGFVETYAKLATVAARRRPVSVREIEIAGRTGAKVSDVFYFEAGTALGVQDRLVVGPESWEVVGLKHPSAEHHLEVFAERTQKGAS